MFGLVSRFRNQRTVNFRIGIGCSQVPFEFYDQIQIKNGGYNAEFGRSIGGVINATTKSGGNEFHAGVNMFWEPDALAEDKPNTFRYWNDEDERDSLSYDLWASGPIIQDRLFYYALYNPQKRKEVDAELTRHFDSEWTDEFWALKLDWVITDGHTLGYTGFDDTREEVQTVSKFSDETGKGDYLGTAIYHRGGENHALKYTGLLTEWATLNVQYGTNEYNRSDLDANADSPAILDYRSGTRTRLGNGALEQIVKAVDEREAARIDADFFLGDHIIRVGIDREENSAKENATYAGGHVYLYFPSGNMQDRVYQNIGSFSTETTAYYIQDEYILGYDWSMGENWNMGVRFVYRDLKSTIEDIAVDAALNEYARNAANNGVDVAWADCDGDGVPEVGNFACGFNYYVLTNPNTDLTFSTDLDGDGQLDSITLAADALGYPDATRKYKTLEFTFSRVWNGKWMMGGSLVWSKSEGNHEGYVKSDNAQDDAGITTSFDQPGLTHGMYGYLPNDRRWTLKTWGSYQLDSGLLLGANFTAQDGRPINCIGVVPADADPYASAYGAAGMYCDDQLAPRGSGGRTADIYNLDLSATYTFNLAKGSEVVVRADVFNVFNWDSEIEVEEEYEDDEDDDGNVNPNYKSPTNYQSPRRVHLGVNYRF